MSDGDRSKEIEENRRKEGIWRGNWIYAEGKHKAGAGMHYLGVAITYENRTVQGLFICCNNT